MATITCTDPEHYKHLCQMVALERPLSEIKPFVRDGKFICKFCARVTSDPARVCKPEPLD